MKIQVAMKTDTQNRREKKLARLVSALREGDNFEKDKAMEQLVSSPDKMAVERIVPLLKDPNTGTRMIAQEILKKIGNCNLPSVHALLNDENEDVRVYGCEILGSLREPDSLPGLIRKVYEDAENVRNTATIALGEFNDERAVAALLDALKDVDWIVFSAIYSLGKIGSTSAVQPLIELFRDGQEEVSLAACEVLIGFNDGEVLDRIFKVLKSWDQKKRDTYLKIILEKGDEDTFLQLKQKIGKELFEHLLNCIRYENKRSLQMMRLIAHFHKPETCEVILDTLRSRDPDDEESNEILMLLAGLRGVWEPAVADYLKRKEEWQIPFIKAVVLAGARIEDSLLFDTFRTSSANVRREIVRSVPTIAQGDGLGLLKEAIKDADGHVRGDAVTVMGTMGAADFKEDVARLAQEDFLDVRMKALRTLVTIDRDHAVRMIERFVGNGTSDDKKVYLSAAALLDSESNLPFIGKLLADSDEGIRRNTVGVVGNFLDDKRYVNLFKMLLMSDVIPHEVLKVIKEKVLVEFRERLIEIFSNPDMGLWTRYYALSALGAFEDRTLFEIFIWGLADDNSLIKIGSLKALSDLHDVRAIEHVRPFALSADEDVRSTAEFVITKLEEF
jgi:HEAT repeat protein